MIITKEMPVEQKNIIGMKALSGSSVTKLSQEFEVNRVFVYAQKSRIKEMLESESPYSNRPVVEFDQRMIEKIIIAGMLICKGSTEDIQRFLNEVFGLSLIHISEPTRLGMISYAVFCLKKKKNKNKKHQYQP